MLALPRRPQCDAQTGFANDDIFFLETCLFSQICTNNNLFEIGQGDDFFCEVSPERIAELQGWLTEQEGWLTGPL